VLYRPSSDRSTELLYFILACAAARNLTRSRLPEPVAVLRAHRMVPGCDVEAGPTNQRTADRIPAAPSEAAPSGSNKTPATASPAAASPAVSTAAQSANRLYGRRNHVSRVAATDLAALPRELGARSHPSANRPLKCSVHRISPATKGSSSRAGLHHLLRTGFRDLAAGRGEDGMAGRDVPLAGGERRGMRTIRWDFVDPNPAGADCLSSECSDPPITLYGGVRRNSENSHAADVLSSMASKSPPDIPTLCRPANRRLS
jgi:hypothetical protein